jgi:DNA-binding response OmpR family regulator
VAKILVIEDEESIRENILDLLEAENFEGIGAINGKVGIKLANEQIPDLILCDMMMPGSGRSRRPQSFALRTPNCHNSVYFPHSQSR